MKVNIKYRCRGEATLYDRTYEAGSLGEAEMHLRLDFYHGELEFRPVDGETVNELKVEACTVRGPESRSRN